VEEAKVATPIPPQETPQPSEAEPTQALSAGEQIPSVPATTAETVAEKAPEPTAQPTTVTQTPPVAEEPAAQPAKAAAPIQPEQSPKPGKESQQAARIERASKYHHERKESVSEILQEFDAMRKAAEAERQAMRELMEKERSQRWQSMPRYPAYPGWQERGSQQPSAPGYYPYGYGYPQ
jgi:hypothetical protein